MSQDFPRIVSGLSQDSNVHLKLELHKCLICVEVRREINLKTHPGGLPGSFGDIPFLMASWRLPGDFLGTSWGLPGDFLGTSWGLPGDFLGTSWGLPGNFLGILWGLPLAYLRRKDLEKHIEMTGHQETD